MLTQRLLDMEEDGLVVRSDRSIKVRHLEYFSATSAAGKSRFVVRQRVRHGQQSMLMSA